MSDPVDGLDWLCWDPNEFGLLSADNNVIEGTFPSRVIARSRPNMRPKQLTLKVP